MEWAALRPRREALAGIGKRPHEIAPAMIETPSQALPFGGAAFRKIGCDAAKQLQPFLVLLVPQLNQFVRKITVAYHLPFQPRQVLAPRGDLIAVEPAYSSHGGTPLTVAKLGDLMES